MEGRSVQTLGQVVHNPQVVAELEGIGITVKENRDAQGASTDTVAITAHGVGETTVGTIEEQGFNVIDTTCNSSRVRSARRSTWQRRASAS